VPKKKMDPKEREALLEFMRSLDLRELEVIARMGRWLPPEAVEIADDLIEPKIPPFRP
jgi:hypothetical protein